MVRQNSNEATLSDHYYRAREISSSAARRSLEKIKIKMAAERKSHSAHPGGAAAVRLLAASFNWWWWTLRAYFSREAPLRYASKRPLALLATLLF